MSAKVFGELWIVAPVAGSISAELSCGGLRAPAYKVFPVEVDAYPLPPVPEQGHCVAHWSQAGAKVVPSQSQNAFGAAAPSAPNPFGFSFACGPKWTDFVKVLRFPPPPFLIILNKRRCG